MLVSGALVAALFLLVILLINGWRLEPLQAGAVVTVMPISALLAARFAGAISPLWTRAASGVILISGGLAALGWLPKPAQPGRFLRSSPSVQASASPSRRSRSALAGRASQVVHGGWTLAARHAGVVLGLLLLTPIFTTDLERNGDEALAAGTAYVLDSGIPPLEKLGVAREILAAVDDAEAEARVPDVGQIVTERGDEPAYTDLAGSLQDQLDRAATNAFSRSFLAAASASRRSCRSSSTAAT